MLTNRLKAFIQLVLSYSPQLIIIGIALIPVYYTWGKLAIGGDVMMFFDSYGIRKSLYQWVNMQNGQYYFIDYYPFYFMYKLAGLFTNNVYIASSALLFTLTAVGGFGMYKLCGLFSKGVDRTAAVVAVVFYLLSPALFNGYHYLFVYYFSPWFLYFVLKVSRSKAFPIIDIVLLNIVLMFCSMDLPNPKYVFHLFLIACVVFTASWVLKLTPVTSLNHYVARVLVTLLVSTYLMLPLAYFAKTYTPAAYKIQDYSDIGRLPNYGIDTLDKVFKLHQDFVFLNTKDSASYNTNSIVLIASYVFAFLIILHFLLAKPQPGDERREEHIIWVLLLIYLFFGAGPNYPLGSFYHFMVTKTPLLAFLRTTAGAVFFQSLFYALLLFFFTNRAGKYKILVAATIGLTTLLVGYPFINGDYYKNFNEINKATNVEERGIVIPQAYYRAREILDYQKIDARTFYPNTKLAYLNTKWGFFGPPIYNFLYDSYNIGCSSVVSGAAKHNVGLVFVDHSLLDDERCQVDNTVPAWTHGFIDIQYASRDTFLPRVHTTTPEENTGLSTDGLYGPSAAVVEYKTLNPTKYRVIIHNAADPFMLILSEQFHKDWKVYSVPTLTKPADIQSKLLSQASVAYRVLDKNGYFQADQAELASYIKKGLISTLGNTTSKSIQHFTWEESSGKLDYVEPYQIDFVSKIFHGTIQNNNLSQGRFWETWLPATLGHRQPKLVDLRRKNAVSQLPDESHIKVNGYANGWLIDTAAVCATTSFCTANANGTYDMQLILEFWPQRVFYISVGISLSVLVLGTAYAGYSLLRKKHSLNK
jgi:hypothetical protein